MGVPDKHGQPARSYDIGQIVFVLSENAQKIVPVVIVEEITIKKLEGNQVSWKVSVGPKGKEKIVDSSRLNGELYTSLDEVREILKKRLSAFLNQIISDGEDRALKWYGKQQETKSTTASANDTSKIDPENLLDSFDEPVQKTKTPVSKKTSQEQLREELRRNLSEPDELMETGEDRGMIELPDGTIVKANIKFNEQG